MNDRDVQLLPTNQPVRLSNISCPYCGSAEAADNPFDHEHVIGRRFVPKGSLAQQWSLILRSCRKCNNEKSDLENDISAITLLPDLGNEHRDPLLAEISTRKSVKSFSRLTKKSVANSYHAFEAPRQAIDGMAFQPSFIGPPQIEPARVSRLAWFHVQGFFYFLSYDAARQVGGFLPGECAFLDEAPRSDWGNALQIAFADLTRDWATRVECVTATGYFRIAIRRDTRSEHLWSFAIEWNKARRIIGFFGDLVRAESYVDEMPEIKFRELGNGARIRREVSLPDGQDRLFVDT